MTATLNTHTSTTIIVFHHFIWFRSLFFLDFCFLLIFGRVNTVDAVYAMAYALHKIIKEQCNDIEFGKCSVMQAGTMGPDLLRAIREISFTGMQGTQVRIQRSIYSV